MASFTRPLCKSAPETTGGIRVRPHDRQRNFVEPERPSTAPAVADVKRTVDLRQVRADDFRYLSAIARTGTRRSAALDLGVDHTTVSRRFMPWRRSSACG